MEYILAASVAALSEVENASILGIPRLLLDERYREWVIKQVTDPAVQAFWQREFAGYDNRFRSEVIAPVQNKVGQLVMSSPIRNIVGQVRSKISPRFIMDRRRIFIANLSKGRLGAETANLLGALLVSQFQLAAMARADVPEAEREDFFLSIDEFPNFSTDSFASILSEARKYRLCLTLSHQYIGQLKDEIRQAVFGNCGSILSFRVGEADARVLAEAFAGSFTSGQFTDLANHEVLVRRLTAGSYGEPFRGTTLPPVGRLYGRRDNLIARSRERYGTPRATIEDKIARWMKG
jgi:hypothetical protein